MKIEFSKNEKGKVAISYGCTKNNQGNYQKFLKIDEIKDGINCKVGDKIHEDNIEKTLAILIFNKNESIDLLINKLKELKCLDVERTLKEKRGVFICNNTNCSCQLTKNY